ncbi:MAG: cobyric acid synthase [Alphaproteobacteria bacterium]
MTKKIKGSLMVQGTASSAGKSLIVMGLCRILTRKNIKVAPFKPQNMSNNAMVADDGGEIGRAQAFQAMACGIATSHHFNPILLKPLGNNLSQLVVHGEAGGNLTAKQYYAKKNRLIKKILESYRHLQQIYDVVIVEGAGSPAEVNLRKADMANMGFADKVKCPVLLVGDIDRGGVIASLVGSHAVLSTTDRNLIKGFIINKFRGDEKLFIEAEKYISQKTAWQNLGIIPFFEKANMFPDEDSLSFQLQHRHILQHHLPQRVAVFQTPHMAQSDDLLPLQYMLNNNGYGLSIIKAGDKMPSGINMMILMGSKNTNADLKFLRDNDFDKIIIQHYQHGGMVVGLCGGYQMLGQDIIEKYGVESHGYKKARGLGLIPTTTILEKTKILSHASGQERLFGTTLQGYEIHAGITRWIDSEKTQNHDVFMTSHDGKTDGYISRDKKLVGTYLHGLFGNHAFLLRCLTSNNLTIHHKTSYHHALDRAIDDWADFLSHHLNIKKMMGLIK